MAGHVAFFELGVDDLEQARRFYGELFDWTFEPGPSGEGLAIKTPTIPGGVHAGDAGGGPYLFFAVDDLDAAVERVRELGGAVDDVDLDGDEQSRSTYGRFVLCQDDQGSPFGLHEAPPGE